MKIKIKNYGITAKAKLDPDSDIWEVTDVISGLLQVIGFGEDTVAQAIKEEDQDLWLASTRENLDKWAGKLCLCRNTNEDGEDTFFLASLSGDPMIAPFIPISTLCG